jgi:hypothetical protein
MKTLATLVAPVAFLVVLAGAATAADDGFVPLFDGKSLDGWHARPGGNWAVQDAVILGTSEKTERRHGLLVTDRKFKDFAVRLKFKATKGNSGLYFRIDEVDEPVGCHGFQAEIADRGGIGGLYETRGRAWVVQPKPEQVAKYFKPGEWNTMTVTAKGRNVTVEVNGTKTAELTNDPGRTEGHIALQLHGGQDMHVEFKDVEIRED